MSQSAKVIAPSGPFDKALFERGLAVARRHFDIAVDPRIDSKSRYLAGDDVTRLDVLQEALDSEVTALLVARGGYGAMRLLPHLSLPVRPPVLVGFSDVTALHSLWLQRGLRSVHGPVLTQLGGQPTEVAARLFSLFDGQPPPPLHGNHTHVPGVAEGPLVGGNLSVLAALAGTPYFPRLDGAVVLLEDVGERPYKLDRLWTQLRLEGSFTRCAGIVLGDFTECEERNADYTSTDVIADLAQALGKPCLAGLPIGHGAVNMPVVLGARARLDATAQTLSFVEGLFA